MNKELFFLIKKHTDLLIEQTKTKPQETPKFKFNRQLESFSFSSPKNLVEEGKRLLVMTSFEVTNSVFNATNEKSSFWISKPGFWFPRGGAGIVNELREILLLRAQNDIELYVEEVRRRRTQIQNTRE